MNLFSQSKNNPSNENILTTDSNSSVNHSHLIHKLSPNNSLPQCLFHPQFTLTNFCSSPQCLLPMCAICISLHTEQHMEKKTHGKYLNLYDIRQDVKSSYSGSLRFFQAISQQYTSDYQHKLQTKQKFKNKFQQFKDKIIRDLDRIMTDLQIKLINNIQHFIENSLEKYQNIQQKVQLQYQRVRKNLQFIHQYKGIKAIIHYYAHQNQQLEFFKTNIRKQVELLKKQGVNILIPQGINLKLNNIFQGIQVKPIIVQKMGSSLINFIKIGNKVGFQFNKSFSTPQ